MQNSAALKTEYSDFFTAFVLDDTARQRFVSALHHSNTGDHRGNMIRLILETAEVETVDEETETMEDKPSANTYASKDIEPIIDCEDAASAFDAPAVYVSVNSFCGFRRKVKNCYSIDAFFIDLDGHDLSEVELEAELTKAKHILNAAFNSGMLLRPSKVTRTGRGYGIFYILERSIAAKIPQTEKVRKYYDMLYKFLIKAYTAVLERGGSKLEVDTKVTDRARVCRLPDTYNYRAGAMCRLYDTPDLYYTLDQIKEGCHLEDYAIKDPAEYHRSLGYDNNATRKVKTGDKTGEGLHKSNIVDFTEYRVSNMLNSRIRAIYALQQYFNEHGQKEGERELLCFLLYNSLVQLTDRASAKEQVKEFNQGFLEPLPERDLTTQSFASVDQEGCYTRLSNDWIISKLKIDYDIANECGLLVSHKAEVREQAKAATAQKRENREDIILACKKENADLKRVDLLVLINKKLTEDGLKTISIKTLDRVLKLHGFGRPGTLAFDQTAEYKREQRRKADCAAAKIKKFPKNAYEYCSVPGGDSLAASFPADTMLYPVSDMFNSLSGSVAPAGSILLLTAKDPVTGDEYQLYNKNDITFCQTVMEQLFNHYMGLPTVHLRHRMHQGVNIIFKLFKETSDYNMLYHSLEELSLSITGNDVSQRKVSIFIHGRKVPASVYETGSLAAYKKWVAPIEAKIAADKAEAERKAAEEKAKAEKQNELREFFRAMNERNKTPKQKRFDWLQQQATDLFSPYREVASIYRFFQINLKPTGRFYERGFIVGDDIYMGKDIRAALELITLDDLKDMPIPGADAPEQVAWAEVVFQSVRHWFEVSKKRGYTIKPIEDKVKRPLKITSIAKYAPERKSKTKQPEAETT